MPNSDHHTKRITTAELATQQSPEASAIVTDSLAFDGLDSASELCAVARTQRTKVKDQKLCTSLQLLPQLQISGDEVSKFMKSSLRVWARRWTLSRAIESSKLTAEPCAITLIFASTPLLRGSLFSMFERRAAKTGKSN